MHSIASTFRTCSSLRRSQSVPDSVSVGLNHLTPPNSLAQGIDPSITTLLTMLIFTRDTSNDTQVAVKNALSVWLQTATESERGACKNHHDLIRLVLKQRATLSNGDTLPPLDLRGIELEKADLTNTNLSNADLTGASLKGANLKDANMTGANFEKARLEHANLSNADLTGASLKDANLMKANLTNANLIKVQLQRAICLGACLDNANLRDANLERCVLCLASLINANLDRAHLHHAHLEFAVLDGASMIDANLTNAYLISASLKHTLLSGANLSDAELVKADFTGADLSYANLSRVVLDDTNNFSGTLSYASFLSIEPRLQYMPNGLTVDHPSFKNTLVTGTIFSRPHFSDGRLSNNTIWFDHLSTLLKDSIGLPMIHVSSLPASLTPSFPFVYYLPDDGAMSDDELRQRSFDGQMVNGALYKRLQAMNPQHASLDKPDRTITLLPNAQGTVDFTHVVAFAYKR